ncbi:MAG: DUF2781 domain-containing protein [Myxococcales bacterium]|nr:DUF2781 domain-containing protein [Myxococcales bacterium]
MTRYEKIPLAERKDDIAILVYFVVNLFFITYMVDVEQLTVADPWLIINDPVNAAYPAWPPQWMIHLVHWWGQHFDPVLLERPPWWRATIWIDSLFFGPYYLFAIPAFAFGWDKIRGITLVYTGVMITNVTVILFEEFLGPHHTPAPFVVGMANLPWLLFPAYIMQKMLRKERPFSRPAPGY